MQKMTIVLDNFQMEAICSAYIIYVYLKHIMCLLRDNFSIAITYKN